ncbi:MAG: hypothetical protein EHM72_05280 [Calditrichaeota bacterium]|nr:MAG: hypothetical protein EHM72_05280 [Calditrichota bacterium]
MNSRDKILSEIRSARQNPSLSATAFESINTAGEKAADKPPKNLPAMVQQFQKELQIVAGEFYLADTEAKAVDIIANCLKQEGFSRLMTSGTPGAERLAKRLNAAFTILSPPADQERKSYFADIPVALVDVDWAIAETGALVIHTRGAKSTFPYFLPQCLIALVRSSQLLADNQELFDTIEDKDAQNTMMITGPSRTADIEKILILGAHGPRRLLVIFMENE